MEYNGILLIDKPAGFTSFDVIAKLRGMLGTKKIGHSGTLDPMATGVLPLFVGNCTKIIDLLADKDKGYIAHCQLGVCTDTLDSTGEVTGRFPTGHITKEMLLDALGQFTGVCMQVPPMYSAVKQQGVKLYELARKGMEVARKARKVEIFSITLLDFSKEAGTFSMEVHCSKGTYIRTLIDDIGKALGSGAMMTGLVRTRSNGFALAQCHSLEEVQSLCDKGELGGIIAPPESALTHLQPISMKEWELGLFFNGVLLEAHQVPLFDTDFALVYSEKGELVGICYYNGKKQVRSKLFFMSREAWAARKTIGEGR